MEESLLTRVGLPIALFIIMLGLGFSLTPADFRRSAKRPVPVFIGIACQMILLPLLGFGVAIAFGLTGSLAVGLVILSLCPGGVTSNLLSFLSKGDVALSITLTAVSSVLTPITVPLISGIALAHFGLEGEGVSLPIPKTMGALIAITILPVTIGMVVRAKREAFAKAAERPVRIASALFLVLIIAGVAKKNWAELPGFFAQVGAASLALNVAAMLVGVIAARAAKLKRAQATTIGIEVGIQNGTTAIFITSTLLSDPVMSVAPAVYSLIMFATGAVFGTLMSRGADVDETEKDVE